MSEHDTDSNINFDNNSTTTTNTEAAAKRKRTLSKFDVAATYAREPARARSLTIAYNRETGANAAVDAAAERAGSGEIPWYQTIHKLHLVCAIFALLGFILGMVCFLTDWWYQTRFGADKRNNGLFWECYNHGCIEIDWHPIYWTTHCTISESALQWSYYVNRGFIFTSIVCCVIDMIIICLSYRCYLTSMQGHSWAVLIFTFIPVLCWTVAIGRFASWQNSELYCGGTYCEMKLSATGDTDCEEGFGYSFVLGILCFIFHIFGSCFAIGRHCFGEWTLEEASGEDLAATTRRVNVEHVVKQRRMTMMNAANERDRSNSTATSSNEPTASGSNKRAGKRRAAHNHNDGDEDYDDQHGSYNNAASYSSQAGADAAAVAMAMASLATGTPASGGQTSGQQHAGLRSEGVSSDDWELDEESGLEWSEKIFMYRDPETKHIFDPSSDMWYDPEIKEWYVGDQ